MGERRRRGKTGKRALPPGTLEVLNALDGHVLLVTPRLRVAYASRAWAKLATVFTQGRLSDPELAGLVAEALTSEEPITRAWHTTTLGPLRHVVARAARLSRWVLIDVRDRTAEVEAVQARRDVVANLGHELRTPVTSVGLIAQALQSCPDDPATVARFADRLAGVAEHLDQLADSMVTLALAQDPEPVALARLELGSVVKRAAKAHAEAAEATGVRMIVKAKDGVWVLGHTDSLMIAVGNLISNALQYSLEGSTVRASLQVDRADRSVAVCVADQGIGIAPSDRERVFERFYRTDEARSRRAGGAGLGLAIVKNIALAHGGSVNLDSRPGAGSTFRLILPLAPHDDGSATP